MDRFKSLLVAACPGHLEPMTMRAAVKLADTNDAHLTVLNVVPPVPRLRRKIDGAAVGVLPHRQFGPG